MERFDLCYCLQVTLGLNRVQDGRSYFLGCYPGPDCNGSLTLCVTDHSPGPSTWHVLFCWVTQKNHHSCKLCSDACVRAQVVSTSSSDAPPLKLKSDSMFLIPGGVCKVAAMVVTDGVDMVTDVFPEGVEGVEAQNSWSTSLLTFCWFNIANSACNRWTALRSIFIAK